jgi:hypothetical protein
MEEIIEKVDREIIKGELTKERFLRRTNRGNNEIYIITCNDAPNTMREIGRLREVAFRHYGGGTGLACDIDEFDTMASPYKQLLVWSPEDEEILGGYRFITGPEVKFDAEGKPLLATSHLFNFSPKFINDILPYTIELGRSFVTLEYQSSLAGTKGLFALDNLWDGLGALSVVYPETGYYFGKITMYNTYNPQARDMILYFMQKHFPDKETLVTPIVPLQTQPDLEQLKQLFSGSDFKEDYKTLNAEVRKLGYNIPPLVNAYISLSPKMRTFGTAINEEFGMVEETGILIAYEEIIEAKRERYIYSFMQQQISGE